MSKRNRKARHLAPVPADAAAPPARSAFERIDIPTGGHTGISGLVLELARHAFPGAFAGYAFELTARGPVCSVTVRTSDRFTSEQVDEGRLRILRALAGFGILKPKPAAPAPESTPAPAEDGAESQLPPPQSPPT